jgi:hypothetical protein
MRIAYISRTRDRRSFGRAEGYPQHIINLVQQEKSS